MHNQDMLHTLGRPPFTIRNHPGGSEHKDKRLCNVCYHGSTTKWRATKNPGLLRLTIIAKMIAMLEWNQNRVMVTRTCVPVNIPLIEKAWHTPPLPIWEDWHYPSGYILWLAASWDQNERRGEEEGREKAWAGETEQERERKEKTGSPAPRHSHLVRGKLGNDPPWCRVLELDLLADDYSASLFQVDSRGSSASRQWLLHPPATAPAHFLGAAILLWGLSQRVPSSFTGFGTNVTLFKDGQGRGRNWLNINVKFNNKQNSEKKNRNIQT